MSFNKIETIKKLTSNEINEKIIDLKKEIFNLKFQQATKQKVKPHIFKHKKHELAQLLMIETKRLNA